eukprot:2968238-Amphidinium_carterae.1
MPVAVQHDPYKPGSVSETLEPVAVGSLDAVETGSVEYERYFITIDKRTTCTRLEPVRPLDLSLAF